MKNFLLIFLILIVVFSVGCTNNNDSSYEKIGEIVEFNENFVSILSGDTVSEYKINFDEVRNFYIGEKVKVKKDGWWKYQLVKNDYYEENKYTSNGYPIVNVTGKVTDTMDGMFLFSCELGIIEFEVPKSVEVEKDCEFSIEFIQNPENNIILSMLREDSRMDLTVRDIKREEDTGIMKIETIDLNKNEYDVCVMYGTVLKFNLYDIKINDKITVYPKASSNLESKRIEAILILK